MITAETAKLAIEVHERRACPQVGAHGTVQDIRFLALAMAGEAGEAANIVKKAWRDGARINKEKLMEEIAGTACYLVGLASALEMNLDHEMRVQMAAFEKRYEDA